MKVRLLFSIFACILSTSAFAESVVLQNFAVKEYDDTHDILMSELATIPGFPKLDYDENLNDTFEADTETMISTYETAVKTVLSQLPDSSLKNGVQKYLEIINARHYAGGDSSVGATNAGIVAYNQNFIKENPCFAKIAEAFYSEINQLDAAHKHNSKYPFRESRPMKGRASLDDESGKGMFSDLQPGWLFDKALEYSGGDRNLAISLLNVCGHDDTAQGDLRYDLKVKRELSDDEIQEYVSAIDEEIIMYTPGEGEEVEAQITKYLEQLKDYREKIKNRTVHVPKMINRQIICPEQNSTFFMAKALGEEVDLPEETKERIGTIQAPNRGRKYLPAKNYHYIGAAFMACNLIQQGVSPNMAAVIQGLAGHAYRSIRMNDILKSDLNEGEQIEKRYNAYLWKASKKIKKLSLPEWLYKYGKDNQTALDTPIFESVQEAEDYLIPYEAAKYFDNMTIGGKTMGIDFPHTDVVINMLEDPVKIQMDLINYRKRHNRPIAKSLAEKAKLKAMTYLVDWDWTYQQHKIGGKFAAKNCSKLKSPGELEDHACKSFDNQPGITCSVDYNRGHGANYSTFQSDVFDGEFVNFVKGLGKLNESLEKKYLDPYIKFDGHEVQGAW